jgi:hypothetical protein
MKFLKLILPAITFVLLTYCNSKTSEPVKKILINEPISMVEFSEVFADFEFIHLKYPEFVAPLYRSKVRGNNYFLLDGKKERVYIMNELGESSLFLNSKGEGPESYGKIHDFQVLEGAKELVVLDKGKNSIIKYGDNSFLENIRMEKTTGINFGGFQLLDNTKILLNIIAGSPYRFMVFDFENSQVEWKSPLDSIFHGLDFGSDKSFTKMDNTVSLIHPFEPIIRSFNKDFNIESQWDLDFGKNNITHMDVKEWNNDPNLAFNFILDQENIKAHSFLLEETESFYIIQYFLGPFGNGRFIKTIIDKKSGRNISIENLAIEGIEISANLLGVEDGDKLIWAIDVEKLNQLSEIDKERLLPYKVDSLFYDQNPILLRTKIAAIK